MSSEQKVVIVTGASQGIGAGLVRAYRDRNYRTVFHWTIDRSAVDPCPQGREPRAREGCR